MELLPCPFCGGEALPTAHLTYNWFAPVCRRCNVRGPSVKIERDSDPQEMRNLMNQADENWNRRASPTSAPVTAPDYRIADRGFRWDAETRQHIPQLLIEFAPVPENAPNASSGWKDRDKLAAMLVAAPAPPVSESVDPVMTKEELIAAAESIGMRFPGASIPPVSEDRWLPIETAPKDGIEVWCFNGEHCVMRWISSEGYALWVHVDPLLSDADPEPEQPSHWMPLPEAPAMQEDKP